MRQKGCEMRKNCGFGPLKLKIFKKMIQVLESTADTEHVQPSFVG
jgi:hypothetical protein